MFHPHSPLPPHSTGLDLIVLLDKRPHAASRHQLISWSRRCTARGGLGFVAGASARVMAQLSRGLRATIYNAGSREAVPVTDLLGWLDWQRLVLIENGRCWELPLAAKQLYTPAAPIPASENLAYQRLGHRYTDHQPPRKHP